MSQERPFGNSGAEHHPEPNHPQPTEEAMVVVPTPNYFWRMIIDPEFPSPTSNPASFVVTIEAFLGLTSQVQPLAGMVQTINEVLKSRGEDEESSTGGSPFTPEIQAKPLPTTFRLPALEPYDGSGDPMEHITAFRAQMALYDTSDALMCRAFPTTLRGSARIWYSRLKPASIPSFDLLPKEFEINFLARARPKPTTASLLGMAQGGDEPLSQFVGWFISQVQGISYLHPSLAIQALLTGLRPSRFFWSLIKRPPATLPEMLQRAHQYVVVETLVEGKREETKRPRGEQSRGHPTPPSKMRENRSGMLPARPPLNSPQFNSNRDLLSDPGKGSLEGPKPNEITPRAT
ncbi:hypothetical protein BHM03_00015729 [Ensete ventricosum]|nr:hypothetical protein BHM03_00015729 [Ensete ventricosum]